MFPQSVKNVLKKEAMEVNGLMNYSSTNNSTELMGNAMGHLRPPYEEEEEDDDDDLDEGSGPPSASGLSGTSMNAQLALHRDDSNYYLHMSHHGTSGGGSQHDANVMRTRRRKAGIAEDKKTCVVCGEYASGYNFDQLTCESCKAFFRRNAIKPRDKIKPCTRDGNCEIAGSQRKHCPSCRLDKCLRAGMKKELILPPEKLETRAKPKRRRTSHTSTSETSLPSGTGAFGSPSIQLANEMTSNNMSPYPAPPRARPLPSTGPHRKKQLHSSLTISPTRNSSSSQLDDHKSMRLQPIMENVSSTAAGSCVNVFSSHNSLMPSNVVPSSSSLLIFNDMPTLLPGSGSAVANAGGGASQPSMVPNSTSAFSAFPSPQVTNSAHIVRLAQLHHQQQQQQQQQLMPAFMTDGSVPFYPNFVGNTSNWPQSAPLHSTANVRTNATALARPNNSFHSGTILHSSAKVIDSQRSHPNPSVDNPYFSMKQVSSRLPSMMQAGPPPSVGGSHRSAMLMTTAGALTSLPPGGAEAFSRNRDSAAAVIQEHSQQSDHFHSQLEQAQNVALTPLTSGVQAVLTDWMKQAARKMGTPDDASLAMLSMGRNNNNSNSNGGHLLVPLGPLYSLWADSVTTLRLHFLHSKEPPHRSQEDHISLLNAGILSPEDLCNRMDKIITCITNLAKHVPGFRDLRFDYQANLVKKNIFGLILIVCSFLHDKESLLSDLSRMEANNGQSGTSAGSTGTVDDCPAGNNNNPYESQKTEHLLLSHRHKLLSITQELEEAVVHDDYLRVSVFALRLFSTDGLPEEMLSTVKSLQLAVLRFIRRHLTALSSSSALKQQQQPHPPGSVRVSSGCGPAAYSRILLALSQCRTHEARLRAFTEFLRSDHLIPLMRELFVK